MDSFIDDWSINRNDNSWMTVTSGTRLDYNSGSGSPSYPVELSILRADYTSPDGGYDVNFEFNVTNALGATAGNWLGMYVTRISDGRNIIAVDWYKVTTARFEARYNNLVYSSITTSETSGKFRIRRDATDNKHWCYYDVGSGWEWDGNPAGFKPYNIGFSDSCRIELRFQQGNGNGWAGNIQNLNWTLGRGDAGGAGPGVISGGGIHSEIFGGQIVR